MITIYEIVLNLFIVALSLSLFVVGLFAVVVIGMSLLDHYRNRQKGDR